MARSAELPLRLAILLCAFVGLRLAEACGVRTEDIDFLWAEVHPKVRYPARQLKTKISQTPVPIPVSLIDECSSHISAYGHTKRS